MRLGPWLVRLLVVFVWTSGLAHVETAGAATYQYSITAPAYQTIANFTAPCAIGPCSNYSTAMSLGGYFQTAAPLAANLSNVDLLPILLAFQFSDGVNVYSSVDAQTRVSQFQATTDASGTLLHVDFTLGRWLSGSAPHSLGDRASFVATSAFFVHAEHNGSCNLIQGTPQADTCYGILADASRSAANVDSPGTWLLSVLPDPLSASAPAPVPMAGDGLHAALTVLLAALGAVSLRRIVARR